MLHLNSVGNNQADLQLLIRFSDFFNILKNQSFTINGKQIYKKWAMNSRNVVLSDGPSLSRSPIKKQFIPMKTKKIMKKYILGLGFVFLLGFYACENKNKQSDSELTAIEASILNDSTSHYYVDIEGYGDPDASWPIGVFDSGTGGLTVLDALVNFDQYNNANFVEGTDGTPDFASEDFIYLADQANMPYGNYYSAGKSDLLMEHIIKDVQFLLGKRYYANANDKGFQSDKKKIKALVIACNTATAYGQEQIDEFIRKTGLNIPVIGVINAGARGTLESFAKEENGSIGVFATVGTIASKGYEKTILSMKDELGLKGDLQVYNQGGHGVAEAVDEEPDFIDRKAKAPRTDYRGPSLENSEFKIDKTLMDVYNFDFDRSKMLCDSQNTDDCLVLQINSADNYVRYHLVSLMEQIRKKEGAQPLKALVLGCTHYPYLKKDIRTVLHDLYNYKGANGEYVYRALMAEEVKIIDPAEFVAKELYAALKDENKFNLSGDMYKNSRFYISVPNNDNKNVIVDDKGRFTYDYKYGRNEGEIQEYVKVVPFDRSNISDDTIERLKFSIPGTFKLIRELNEISAKTMALK